MRDNSRGDLFQPHVEKADRATVAVSESSNGMRLVIMRRNGRHVACIPMTREEREVYTSVSVEARLCTRTVHISFWSPVWEISMFPEPFQSEELVDGLRLEVGFSALSVNRGCTLQPDKGLLVWIPMSRHEQEAYGAAFAHTWVIRVEASCDSRQEGNPPADSKDGGIAQGCVAEESEKDAGRE